MLFNGWRSYNRTFEIMLEYMNIWLWTGDVILYDLYAVNKLYENWISRIVLSLWNSNFWYFDILKTITHSLIFRFHSFIFRFRLLTNWLWNLSIFYIFFLKLCLNQAILFYKFEILLKLIKQLIARVIDIKML